MITYFEAKTETVLGTAVERLLSSASEKTDVLLFIWVGPNWNKGRLMKRLASLDLDLTCDFAEVREEIKHHIIQTFSDCYTSLTIYFSHLCGKREGA